MPTDLNLLPQNLRISKGTGNIIKTAKALSVIMITAFLVFSLVLGAVFIFSKIGLNKVQANVESLKNKVKAQETSEQRLVLLKDRLAKIASIRTKPNASKNVTAIDPLFTGVSPASSLNQANISSTKTDVLLVARSNEDLSAFIRNLKSTTLFSNVSLSSLSYSPNTGFVFTLSMGNK